MLNTIKMSRRAALSLGLAFTLGACAAAPAKEPGASLVSRGYSVSSIELKVADHAYADSGLMRQNPELVQQLETRVSSELKQKASTIKGGAKPAKVKVEVTGLRVANDTSRSILGADTYMTGNVTVSDNKGNLLAQKAGVNFTDAGAKNGSTVNGIPVGFLISTAVNATGASDEKRIARLSTGFTNEVVAWLSR